MTIRGGPWHGISALLAHAVDGASYEAPFWDDLRVRASATKINPATSKPDFGAFPSGATYTKALLFDGGSRETVTFEAQLPHGYKLGTNLRPHVHWAATSVQVGKTVIWELNYILAITNGTFGAETTRTGTFGAADTVTDKHVKTSLQEIDGSTITSQSAMLVCALSRRGDTDTYTDDVAMIEVDFHFQSDSPGSREELSK
jgi:hypothetical protein